jgi:hypothetical protein
MQSRHMSCIVGCACRGNEVLGREAKQGNVAWGERQQGHNVDSQANHPSSSSRRVGAGKGAPGPSVVGSWT